MKSILSSFSFLLPSSSALNPFPLSVPIGFFSSSLCNYKYHHLNHFPLSFASSLIMSSRRKFSSSSSLSPFPLPTTSTSSSPSTSIVNVPHKKRGRPSSNSLSSSTPQQFSSLVISEEKSKGKIPNKKPKKSLSALSSSLSHTRENHPKSSHIPMIIDSLSSSSIPVTVPSAPSPFPIPIPFPPPLISTSLLNNSIEFPLSSLSRDEELSMANQTITHFHSPSSSSFPSASPLIIGVDEAGRGPLCGPVVASAIYISPSVSIEGIFDSKQLNEAQREYLYQKLLHYAQQGLIIYSIKLKTNNEIDDVNILNATMISMQEAVEDVIRQMEERGVITRNKGKNISINDYSDLVKLKRKRGKQSSENFLSTSVCSSSASSPSPSFSLNEKGQSVVPVIFIDGNRLPLSLSLSVPPPPSSPLSHHLTFSAPIIKGDSRVFSIASASILAKVFRDHIMVKYDEKYPQYNWKSNKGYGVIDHFSTIRRFGYCELHRKTFAPIKQMVQREEEKEVREKKKEGNGEGEETDEGKGKAKGKSKAKMKVAVNAVVKQNEKLSEKSSETEEAKERPKRRNSKANSSSSSLASSISILSPIPIESDQKGNEKKTQNNGSKKQDNSEEKPKKSKEIKEKKSARGKSK